MRKGKLPQYPLTLIRKLQQNLTTIQAMCALNIASSSQAIDQLYSAMMLNLKSFRQFADAWPDAFRQPFHGQHKLVLAWLNAGRPGRSLAEVQKPPDLMPQLCKRFVIRQGELFHAFIYRTTTYYSHCCQFRTKGNAGLDLLSRTELASNAIRHLESLVRICACEIARM